MNRTKQTQNCKRIIQVILALSMALVGIILLRLTLTPNMAQANRNEQSFQSSATLSGTHPEPVTPTTVLELFDIPPPAPGQIELAESLADETWLNNNTLGVSSVAVNNLFSDSPIWSSLETDIRSMDWGDVDRDGDLDLAIASTIGGVSVYRNDNGVLNLISPWPYSFHKIHTVRWVDVDPPASNEPNLELIVLGDSVGGSPLGESINQIYTQPENSLNHSDSSWGGAQQLLRIAPGDYNGDDLIDLVASTNSLGPTATCPVLLFLNDGFGVPFDNNPVTSPSTPFCVSNQATASLSSADFDNDGDLDVALSRYLTQDIIVVRNNGFPFSGSIPVATYTTFMPSGLSWGDYDRDGHLDLAAAFPLQKETRIYRNQGGISGFDPPIVLPSSQPGTPMAIDWADINGDGNVDLITAELPPRIYEWQGGTTFTQMMSATVSDVTAADRLTAIRAIDVDNDGDLDLSFTNQFGQSKLFRTTAPHLSATMIPITGSAQSMAWGDIDNDDTLDLVFGAAICQYDESNGDYSCNPSVLSGTDIALGDLDGDYDLDVALIEGSTGKIYKNNGAGNFTDPPMLTFDTGGKTGLAWGYANNDNKLDLLTQINGNHTILIATGTTPTLTSTQELTKPPQIWPYNQPAQNTGNTTSVAWGDYDNDRHLDFAVANAGTPNHVYHNNGDNTFTSVWNDGASSNTRSVAWLDYNGDGFLDLSFGNYDAETQIYENQSGNGAFTLAWSAPTPRQTTSLAWGDWNNDGDVDLALGNENQPDQVYANLGTPNSPSLTLVWQSTEVSATTDVAWGDTDGDGDLDLAVSTNSGQSGLYENNYVLPSYSTDLNEARRQMPLPNNPTYLALKRPGNTPSAYSFSAAEILKSTAPIDINYTLFDPVRAVTSTTDAIIQSKTIYSYSLNAAGAWTTANGTTPSGNTSRTGTPQIFWWDTTVSTPPVGDNACFRITVVHGKKFGPVQRASTSATSPPYRVRALNCNWPANASFTISGTLQTGEFIEFMGDLEQGTGSLQFTWNFGDATPSVPGQKVRHRYYSAGTYDVFVTVSQVDSTDPNCANFTQEAVSIIRQVSIIASLSTIDTDNSSTDNNNSDSVYLPLILKSGKSPTTDAGVPTQVTQLRGTVQTDTDGTILTWNLNPSSDSVTEYRIYRAPRNTSTVSFQLLATVPGQVSHYTDQTATCDQMYYVTAVNNFGESLASIESYFSPECD